MKLQLTRMQSRFAAIGLLLLVICTLVAAVVVPVWWQHKRYDGLIEEYSDRLTRYRRVAALRPRIEDALSDAAKRDSRKFYLKAVSPTLAAAELQGLVTQLIGTNKGRVFSSQIQQATDDPKNDAKDGATPNSPAKSPVKVSVSVQMTASAVPLQLILHAVESQEPYLLIDQLTVRTNQGRGYKPVPGIQPEFVVQMTVSGYTALDGEKP